jgi:hypothetical protein
MPAVGMGPTGSVNEVGLGAGNVALGGEIEAGIVGIAVEIEAAGEHPSASTSATTKEVGTPVRIGTNLSQIEIRR